VRLVELGRLAVALAERALAQASHLGLGLGRSGRNRRLAQVMVATVVIVLLLHAVHAQQELGQRVVVGRDGRGTAAERRGGCRGRRRRRARVLLAVERRRPVRRARRGPVIAQIVQRRLDAGRVLADGRRVPVFRGRGQAQSASVLVLGRLGLAAERESATAAHCDNIVCNTSAHIFYLI